MTPQTKISTINAIDKIVQLILNILALLKNRTSCKKEKNQKLEKHKEKDEENKVLEKGKKLLIAMYWEENIIRNLEKLSNGNDKNTENKAKNF